MKEIMQPLHVVVPHKIRRHIEKAAMDNCVSIGEITRDLLSAGIEARKGCDDAA